MNPLTILYIAANIQLSTVYGAICTEGQLIGPDLDVISSYYFSNSDLQGTASQFGSHWMTEYSGAVIVYEPNSVISCSGLISEWHIVPYIEFNGTTSQVDGCGYGTYSSGCDIDFVIWKDIAPVQPLSSQADYYYYLYTVEGIPVTLVDSNPSQKALYSNTSGYQVIQIAPAEQIPVEPGYYIGWNSPNIQAVEFWADYSGSDCDAAASSSITCYKEYLLSYFGVALTNLDPGVHTTDFVRSGELGGTGTNNRWFGIRVNVTQGTAPTFTNLPSSLNIDMLTATVTDLVFTAAATDAESKQVLTFSLASSSPSGFFLVDSTGLVTVAQSLSGSSSTHVLNIEVTDGILTTTSTLTINDINSLTTSEPVTTEAPATTVEPATTAAPVTTSRGTGTSAVTNATTTIAPATTTTTKSELSDVNTVALISIVAVVSAIALATTIGLAVMCCGKGNSTSPTPPTDQINLSPQQTQVEKMHETPSKVRPKTPPTQQERSTNKEETPEEPESRPPSYNSMTPRDAQRLQPQTHGQQPQQPSQQAPGPYDNAPPSFNQQPPLAQQYQPPTSQLATPNQTPNAVWNAIRDTHYWL